MPFTFAHPAIVLPLAKLPRQWFSTTGLVMGSMAPDFEYFLRMETTSEYSHSIAGSFYFNLPMGLLLSFIFHQIIRNPLIDHLPDELYSRFCRYKSFNWPVYARSNFLTVLYSILIGAFSHLFWDAFTFEDAFFVELFGLEQYSVYSYPLPRIIQHGSTFIGFAFMGWLILRMKKARTSHIRDFSWGYWTMVVIIILVTWVIRIILDDPLDRRETVVTLINGFLLGLIISSFISKKPGPLYTK